jgi:hypothetical protein
VDRAISRAVDFQPAYAKSDGFYDAAPKRNEAKCRRAEVAVAAETETVKGRRPLFGATVKSSRNKAGGTTSIKAESKHKSFASSALRRWLVG